MKHIRILLFFFLICQSYKGSSQIKYLSPKPDSKFNNLETNIILKFDSELAEKDYSEAFKISSIKLGSHPFKIKNSGTQVLLLYPLQDFHENDTIIVELSDTIWFPNNTIVEPFQWQFFTSTKFNKENGYTNYPINNKSPELKGTMDNFPSITVTINNDPAPGKIFFYNVSDLASNNDRFLAIIDNNGNPEYKRQENDKGLGFTLQPSGYMSFWNDGDFVLMDSSYNIIDTIACGNGYKTDFHEFINLPNGHSFLLSWDAQIVDMSEIITNGIVDAVVQGLIIQELDKNKNVVWQWRSWDHFEITDAEDIDFTAPYVSYVHGNGLDITKDGNILLSSRVMNEITKIDRNTGEIIWRFGGKNNQFTFLNDFEGFCRQHHIKEIENGNLTLFDNGTCHTPQISGAKEYKLDIENKTAELVWEYHHPKAMFCSTMGSVQRLNNGNTFINWGMITEPSYPNITEVRPDKTIAFELYLDTYFHLLYRSFRFEWNNEVTTKLGKIPTSSSLKIYPNPASNSLMIRLSKGFSNNTVISLLDFSGKQVFAKTINKHEYYDNQTIKLSISDLKTGYYMVTIKSKNYQESQKIFIVKQ